MKAIEVHADRRLGGARLGSLLAIAAAVLALGIGTLARIGPVGESASGLSAGDLDRTFRGAGKVTTDFGYNEEMRAVAIQADGKIVAAGCIPTAFALARYTPDGTLDSSFGGDGRVTTDLTRRGGDCALGVAIQTDGKIVAAGHSGFGGPNGKFAVVRYNADGTLDTTFGGDGRVTTDFTPDADVASRVIIQTDGKIVAAGQSGVLGTNTMFAVIRYQPDGTLDTTFGGDGRVTTDFTRGEDGANAVAIQADGKIVAAGCIPTAFGITTGFALARYTPDGTLDSSFGGGGRVTTDLTRRGGDCALGVAIQTDGKIVAAGHSGFGGPNGKVAVVRYNSDGTLDTTFGGDGIVITPLTPKGDSASDLAIQTDMKIVVAGQSGVLGTNTMFAVIRYQPDGTLDTTFGGDGRVTTDFTPNADFASGLVLQTDGKIVVAGSSDYLGTHDGFALARYLSEP